MPQSSSARFLESGLKFGALAGFVAAWSISTAIAASELELGLPVGTFYLVLVAAITQATDYGMSAIAQGLLLHLAAGTLFGLVMMAPFVASRKAYSVLDRFAPALGLGAGVLIWAALFVPVTFGTMIPLLQSLDGQSVISQRVPVGNMFQIAVSELLAMMDRVVYTALAFNMFYGLVALILTRSIAGAFVSKKQVIL